MILQITHHNNHEYSSRSAATENEQPRHLHPASKLDSPPHLHIPIVSAIKTRQTVQLATENIFSTSKTATDSLITRRTLLSDQRYSIIMYDNSTINYNAERS